MYEEIIDRWKRANPLSAHYLGFHEYDGMLPDFSQDGQTNRIEEIEADLNELQSISPTHPFAKFEHRLILSRLKVEHFELTERQEFKSNPLTYIYPLTIVESSFTIRSFASVDTRLDAIVRLEQQIPSFLETAANILEASLPEAKVKMSIQFLSGIVSYFKDNLIAFAVKSDNEDLINTWSEANILAVEAMGKFLKQLKTTYLTSAHTDFALGKEKFMRLLQISEGIDISYEDLLAAGEADLERNYQAMLAIGDEVDDLDQYLQTLRKERPAPDKLVEAAQNTLDRTRDFLDETGIVPLPTDEHCEIIETPKYARGFAFAAMNTPGPFEVDEASEAYYWITPPDLEWPAERIDQFMQFFNLPFLEVVTIHEVYPGHFVQLLYNKQSKSEISKMMARSITMIEGWAHYTEEMIYNQGYEPFDRRKLHVGQLQGALMRNCRYISALKLHCEDWTVEDAKRLFMEKGFMPEPTAEIEANRGTIDPMYLNYTLGKLLIMKLRLDYQKEKGDDYDLAEFHKEILSYGSPPISILRDIMLENSSTGLL